MEFLVSSIHLQLYETPMLGICGGLLVAPPPPPTEFVCLGKVLHPVSAPCSTAYIRHVFLINEGTMPYPL